eukprot:GSChrysophyteH1.ASY1.ANO1.1041.1 assembled CDS
MLVSKFRCMKVYAPKARSIGSQLHHFHSSCFREQITNSYDIEGLKKRALEPHPQNNTPSSIVDKVGRNLHRLPDHPLNIIKRRIENYCQDYAKKTYSMQEFAIFDDLSPIVTKRRCFDDLRVGPDHVSRSPSDTYYIDDEVLLRTHTSAHQTELIGSNTNLFLLSGDCFRRDEIDSCHYPVFHQMEGVKIFQDSELVAGDPEKSLEIIENDLKSLLTGLATHLFGDVIYNAGKEGAQGWAFGLGLERLCMVLFNIPDIRLFWTDDERFHKQFVGLSNDPKKVISFVPYSKYPFCYKDVSFWLPVVGGPASFHENDVFEVIRDVAGDLVEEVKLFDEFKNNRTGRTSHAYRISYRHMDRSLTNEEIDEIQFRLRDELVRRLGIELR